MPLSLAPVGMDVKVVRILTDDKLKKHLSNLGIVVGSIVTSVSGNNGGVIIKLKDGRLALDRALASKIIISC